MTMDTDGRGHEGIIDADGKFWWHEAQAPMTPEEEAELERDVANYVEPEFSPEELAEMEAERMAGRAADDQFIAARGFEEDDNVALRFAQGVQAIWDETGRPCRLTAAGRRAQLTNIEFMLGSIHALMKGMARHPVRKGWEYTSLWEPGVG